MDKDAPISRPVQRAGIISSRAILGGLPHHYVRVRFSVHTTIAKLVRPGGGRAVVRANAKDTRF